MTKIAIIGFGVLGKQLFNFLNEKGEVKSIVAFDDFAERETYIDTLLPFEKFLDDAFKDFDFYVGIGYKHLSFRRKVIQKLRSLNRNIPSFIHPTCYVSPYASIGEGCILFPNCNIDQNVTIENGNVFHNSVTISHDCLISESNYISPSVTLCGNIVVGSENFIGAGSIISNGVKVGNNALIGIGSCITRDVSSDSSVIGNPQKTLKNKLKLL